MAKVKNLTNAVFGKLTALECVGRSRNGHALWRCLCSCGKEVVVPGCDLKNGHTKSCGCFRDEVRKETHTTHGMTCSPEYRSWAHMLSRCENPKVPNYNLYGGRGINVCKEWHSFEAFYQDMGLRPSKSHSLDRIDNSKGYSPDNCRWSTPTEQANNKRTNNILNFAGEPITIANLARECGINSKTIYKDCSKHGKDYVESTLLDALLIPLWLEPRTVALYTHYHEVCMEVFCR